MKKECKGVVVDEGKREWGAPNYRVFVIKLGKLINTKNVKPRGLKERFEYFTS